MTLESAAIDAAAKLLALVYANSSAAVTLCNHRGASEIWAWSLIREMRARKPEMTDDELVNYAAEVIAEACAERGTT